MKLVFKNISELPDEIADKLYALRLPVNINTPKKEYIENYCTILVDNCLYFADNEYAEKSVSKLKRLESDWHSRSCLITRILDAVVKDGFVIKNRFGGVLDYSAQKQMDSCQKEDILNEIVRMAINEIVKTDDLKQFVNDYEVVCHIAKKAAEIALYLQHNKESNTCSSLKEL